MNNKYLFFKLNIKSNIHCIINENINYRLMYLYYNYHIKGFNKYLQKKFIYINKNLVFFI